MVMKKLLLVPLLVMLTSCETVPKILLCLISLFTSLIPSSMIDNYLKNNRLTLYFGLGHRK